MARHAKSLYLNDADMLKGVLADNERLHSALQAARPVVANAVFSGTSPWQKETREKILAQVDAALKD